MYVLKNHFCPRYLQNIRAVLMSKDMRHIELYLIRASLDPLGTLNVNLEPDISIVKFRLYIYLLRVKYFPRNIMHGKGQIGMGSMEQSYS
jgi:hypothetical protein